MPNIKAAVKWVRQTEKRTVRNLDTKSRLKTLYKKAVAAADPATTATVEAQFDKAARRRVDAGGTGGSCPSATPTPAPVTTITPPSPPPS